MKQMEQTEILKRNAMKAADIIWDYLNDKIPGSDKVKIASLAITQSIKQQASKGNNDALKFAVQRSMSSNPTEMKDNIRATLPEYVNVKAIDK